MKLELTRRIKKVLIYRHNLYLFKCLERFYTTKIRRGSCNDFLHPVFSLSIFCGEFNVCFTKYCGAIFDREIWMSHPEKRVSFNDYLWSYFSSSITGIIYRKKLHYTSLSGSVSLFRGCPKFLVILSLIERILAKCTSLTGTEK